MFKKSQSIQAIYLYLILGNTLAASLIWGINTIFLLDAGLTNFQAFLANAFFTAGQVLFEVPTGIIADTFGRRTSYLLGALTLAISTLLYFFMWKIHGPFWGWATSSILLGLGFTFFFRCSGGVACGCITRDKFQRKSRKRFLKRSDGRRCSNADWFSGRRGIGPDDKSRNSLYFKSSNFIFKFRNSLFLDERPGI